LDLAFFGLTNKEDAFLEEIFHLMDNFSGIGWNDAYSMPVPYRKYFLRKLIKRAEEAERKKEEEESRLSAAERAKIIQHNQLSKNVQQNQQSRKPIPNDIFRGRRNT
jgi:hypothetical protein